MGRTVNRAGSPAPARGPNHTGYDTLNGCIINRCAVCGPAQGERNTDNRCGVSVIELHVTLQSSRPILQREYRRLIAGTVDSTNRRSTYARSSKSLAGTDDIHDVEAVLPC